MAGFLGSFVEPVGADGGDVGTVFHGPVVVGKVGGQEVEAVAHDALPLQTGDGRPDALFGRLLIDGAVADRLELAAPAVVKDDAVDGVGEVGGGHPVQDHVAHGDLALPGLALAFGGDDAGEPVKLILPPGGSGGGEGDGGGLAVPGDLQPQKGGQGADGDKGAAGVQEDGAVRGMGVLS